MLLDINGLTKSYQRGESAFNAVENASLQINEGDFLRIEGRSGSGKSTFLNMVVGLLAPTSGSIIFQGQELIGLDDLSLSRLRNEAIGYIPQGASLLGNLTILDNIRLPWFLFPRQGDITPRAKMLLEQVGLAGYESQYPANLSGGEMRRVAIARALINEPKLLIADEPTSDLDIETTQEILALIKSLADNKTTVLMVTHERESAILGNRMCYMTKGHLEEVHSS